MPTRTMTFPALIPPVAIATGMMMSAGHGCQATGQAEERRDHHRHLEGAHHRHHPLREGYAVVVAEVFHARAVGHELGERGPGELPDHQKSEHQRQPPPHHFHGHLRSGANCPTADMIGHWLLQRCSQSLSLGPVGTVSKPSFHVLQREGPKRLSYRLQERLFRAHRCLL